MKTSTVLSLAASFAAAYAYDCPGPGETNAAGDYGCNPAHEYPEGQVCEAVDGDCYVIKGGGDGYVCPGPGETNAEGDYGCNPAHEYPSGQACVLVNDDCYVLRGMGVIVPTATSSGAAPTSTCPPAGSTDDKGQYGCNPAHEYPSGQLCTLQGDCYILEGTGVIIPTTTPHSGTHTFEPTHTLPPAVTSAIPTAGAAQLSGAGGLAALAFYAALA